MRNTMLIALMGLVLATAKGTAQTVTWDFDDTADFTRYGTYAWVSGTPVSDDLNHRRIVTAIEAGMTTKGLRPAVDGEVPDLLITYHANFERDVRINASSTDWGTFRWGNRSGTAEVEELLTGSLVLEMFDVEKQTVVWRGIASREIDVKANPEKRTKNISKAVEKLLKHYPPVKK